MDTQEKDRDLFLAMLAHDLVQPLTLIKLAAGTALVDADKKSIRMALQRIGRAANQASNMIDQLLGFARIRNSEKLELEKDWMDLKPLIRELKEDIQFLYPDREIRVVVDGGQYGIWDRHRLLEVFTNLINNALQHGTDRFPVDVRVYENDQGRTCVDVSNEGLIPHGLTPHIFDPFRRGGRTGRGLGLGLFITKSFVVAHGGSIEVFQDEVKTTFRVCLPSGTSN